MFENKTMVPLWKIYAKSSWYEEIPTGFLSNEIKSGLCFLSTTSRSWIASGCFLLMAASTVLYSSLYGSHTLAAANIKKFLCKFYTQLGLYYTVESLYTEILKQARFTTDAPFNVDAINTKCEFNIF